MTVEIKDISWSKRTDQDEGKGEGRGGWTAGLSAGPSSVRSWPHFSSLTCLEICP